MADGIRPTAEAPRTGRWAFLVAAGILVSRIAGLVRTRVFSHYFGLSDSADAFNVAFRIPNFLQNLFGEGALSASFIPVYAALLARGEREKADRVAGAVGALLALIVAVLVVAGVLASPYLIIAIAPGFHGPKRDLTIQLVRILFPSAGALVLSAWCLGILNSHRRFLLSYIAPVVWNAAMIATLVVFGPRSTLPGLAVALAWGSVVGSALQFAVQLPTVRKVAPDVRLVVDTASDHVRVIARNFLPAFVARGVVQISAFIDSILASLLGTGAVAAISNAQLLYTLPVALFGISTAAAELPAMASAVAADNAGSDALRQRIDPGLRRIAFFIVPSAVALLALGDVIAAAVFETGRFTHADAVYVWGILGGSAVGLLANTLGRLYSSAYYALRDTRTPLRFGTLRLVLTATMGYLFALPLPRALGISPQWGAAGLTASAGISAWIEMLLLRRTLNRRIGRTGLQPAYVTKLYASALVAAAAAWGVKLVLPALHPAVIAALVLAPYGLVYFAATAALRIPEIALVLGRLRARRR